MAKVLADIISEAQADGADIATLVADLQAFEAEQGNAPVAATPVSVAITMSDESVVEIPATPAV